MTLNEVLSAVLRLSITEKFKLMQILVKDLGVLEDISPLEPFKTYDPFRGLPAQNVRF